MSPIKIEGGQHTLATDIAVYNTLPSNELIDVTPDGIISADPPWGNFGCKIDSKSWKSCRCCRFNKCIASGMRPGLIYKIYKQIGYKIQNVFIYIHQ